MRGAKNNNRWSMWARSIARRHVRFTERRESLALIVLRMRGPLSVVRERRSFTTRIVRPQVHLAINAVLAQTRHGARTERTFLCAFASLHEKTSSTTTLRLVSQEAHKEVRSERTFRDTRLERQTETERSRDTERMRETVRSRETIRSREAERLREVERLRETERLRQPLTFVFERINTIKNGTNSSCLEMLVHQHARSIVERVTQQSRRHETMHIGGGSDTLITQHMSTSSSRTEITQPRVLKTVTAPTRVIEKGAPSTQLTTVVETAPWLQDKVSVTGMNIDQITDQVVQQLDRRVVATRERMGRI